MSEKWSDCDEKQIYSSPRAMKSSDTQPFAIERIQKWLVEAGQIALAYFQQSEFTYKVDQTPVTEADKAVERFLVEKIRRAHPDHGVIAEEGTSFPGNEYTWVIDPIDGTSAFIMGVPTWCIAVGVLNQNAPYFGMVYLPVTGEVYYAYLKGKAYKNNQEIHVSDRMLIDNQSVLCISTYSCLLHKIIFPGRIFSFGSGVFQNLLVASGKAMASVSLRPKIWDLAAVYPILYASGARIQYFSGEDVQLIDYISGRECDHPICSGHALLLPKLFERIKETSNYQ